MVSREMVLFSKPAEVPDQSGKCVQAACIVYVDALACYYSSPTPESRPSLTVADAEKGDWLFGMQLIHKGSAAAENTWGPMAGGLGEVEHEATPRHQTQAWA